MRALLFLLATLCIQSVSAQEFQNGWSYRNIEGPRYVRLNYENDLVFGTDYYFTQGVHFEYATQAFHSKVADIIFPLGKGHRRFTGIAIESAGYTPTIIFADSILYGNRPFAGLACAKLFSTGLNTDRKERYASTLTVGLMGPSAGGYEIHSAIHKRTGNPDPIGWKYQIGDALVLNYELNYERELFLRKHFILSYTGTARAGTYSIKGAIGGVLMAGWFDNPFQKIDKPAKMQAYLYVHPQFDLVGYDATLQGGLFTDNSPYVISSTEMNHVVFRFDGGVRFGYHRFLLSVYAHYLTKEFGTGLNHATGGIEIGYMLHKKQR